MRFLLVHAKLLASTGPVAETTEALFEGRRGPNSKPIKVQAPVSKIKPTHARRPTVRERKILVRTVFEVAEHQTPLYVSRETYV